MDAGMIIGIAVAAIVLVGLIVVLSRAGRKRRLETRREQAHELRHEAQSRELRAERQQAKADEQSARAKQAAAEAEEKAAVARREEAAARERAQAAEGERRFARERHGEAQAIDPDADDSDGHDGREQTNGRPRQDERQATGTGRRS
jgi:FtsZ-interacting cell division protein ZipA